MTLVQIYNNLADLVDFGLFDHLWPDYSDHVVVKYCGFLYFQNQWVKTFLMICNMSIFKQIHFLPRGSPRGYPLVRGRSYIQWCPGGVKNCFFSVWSRFRHIKKILIFSIWHPDFQFFSFGLLWITSTFPNFRLYKSCY